MSGHVHYGSAHCPPSCQQGQYDRIRADARETHREGQQTAPPAGVASVPTVDAAAVLASHGPFGPSHVNNRVTGRIPFGVMVCICGQEWRGDADTGGCEAVLLARENIALRGRAETAEADLAANDEEFTQVMGATEAETRRATARAALLEGLLREVQHHSNWGTCSLCGWHADHGHAPDCRVAAALAGGG